MPRRTRLLFAALCTALPALLHAAGPMGMPSVAFFYGTQPPMDELAAFGAREARLVVGAADAGRFRVTLELPAIEDEGGDARG